jgi:NADPH:quinone reductase-like Zn-dependent oxidoreductase
MKAVRVHAPGEAGVLQLEELPDPHPGPGQVAIRIRAAGLNHRDIWVRRGNFGGFAEPLVPGSDASGEVLEVGEGVREWQPADRVVVNPNLSCGHCQECLSGRDNACAEYRIWDGAYADTAVLSADQLVRMPSGLTFEEAAAIGVPYVTAEEALTRAGVLPGQTMVVFGATGGLGVAAIQMGRLRGLRVVAITRREGLADRLQREGAHDVVLLQPGRDVTADVQRRTGGRGADLVIDSVGQATFRQSLAMAARGGTVVTVGATSGGEVSIELGLIFRRRLTVLGCFMGHRGVLPRLLTLFGRGELHPVIDEVIPLAEAARAHRKMEEGDLFGKIILVP